MHVTTDSFASRGEVELDGDRERTLSRLLLPRIAVEKHFADLGHTYRHGRLYRKFEHAVTRPVLRGLLRAAGVYPRGLRNALSPVVSRRVLRFENLPPELEGFSILHLSDFHVEGTPGLVDALTPVLEKLNPDVCVMTGDYRFEDHGPSDPVFPLMRRIVSSIRARHGIFAILGNHDSAEIAVRMEREVGVRMLVNEAVPVGSSAAPLWIIGVDDPFDYRTDDLAQALTDVPANSFRVLLAHAPEIYEAAAKSSINLYLSGHTHAGQIRLPYIGAVRQNAKCPTSMVSGFWTYKNLQGYTSAGVGCSSLPVRYLCPPEIVHLELRAV
jgi:uncharacterized protein